MKQIVKNLIPPALIYAFTKIKPNKYGWKGSYNTWEEAKRISIGYDNEKNTPES